MIPGRFNPKPTFKALDNHSPFHVSQVGGHHDRKKRKPRDKSNASKTVGKGRGRRKKLRRTIISTSQEEYLDSNYMLTQPVRYCGANATRGTMERENSSATCPIDLAVLSDDVHASDDASDVGRCIGFRSARSVVSRRSDSDRMESEYDSHHHRHDHHQQRQPLQQRASTSRACDPTSSATTTNTTSTTTTNTRETHKHRSTTGLRRHGDHSTNARNGRCKDLPSVRFGAMLRKAAVKHQALQGTLSMTHCIHHNAKSTLLVHFCLTFCNI